MSKQSKARKPASATPVRDDPDPDDFPPLGDTSVWEKQHTGRENSTASDVPFMVAEFPNSDPGKQNFNNRELESMAINCSRASIRADLNFFEVMIRRIPSAAAVLEMHVSGF